MKTLNTFLFYTALALFLVSCWNRNEFPEQMPLDEAVLEPPAARMVDFLAVPAPGDMMHE